MNVSDSFAGILALVFSALIFVEGTYGFITGTPVLFNIDYGVKITAGWVLILLPVPLLFTLKKHE
jgi:hypothetical protein